VGFASICSRRDRNPACPIIVRLSGTTSDFTAADPERHHRTMLGENPATFASVGQEATCSAILSCEKARESKQGARKNHRSFLHERSSMAEGIIS
jgi:hypothetical protein